MKRALVVVVVIAAALAAVAFSSSLAPQTPSADVDAERGADAASAGARGAASSGGRASGSRADPGSDHAGRGRTEPGERGGRGASPTERTPAGDRVAGGAAGPSPGAGASAGSPPVPASAGDAGVRGGASASGGAAGPGAPVVPEGATVRWHGGEPTLAGQRQEASRMHDYLVVRRDDVRTALTAAQAAGETGRVARLTRELADIESELPGAAQRVRELAQASAPVLPVPAP